MNNSFWKNTWDFTKNAAMAGANAYGGEFGYKPFNDNKFTGTGGQFFDQAGNIGSQLAKTGSQMAMNALLPGSGQALGMIQNQVGQSTNNPNYMGYNNQQPQQGQQMGNMLNMGMQFANMAGAFKYGGKMFYPDGGFTQPNAELEKEENAIHPDGQFQQFDGPSHEGGGIPTNLPSGTMIFSDKLKPQGSKKTFAILNKSNNTTKEDKILEDKNSTNESRKSAQLMLAVKKANSMKLFQEQEMLKQNKFNNYIKRLGGVQKFWGGGTYGPQEASYAPGYNGFLTNGTNSGNTPSNPSTVTGFPGLGDDGGDAFISNMFNTGSEAGTSNSMGIPNSANTNSKFNVNKDAIYQGVGTLAQSAGPMAYLAEQGKKYDTQSFYNYDPDKLDPSSALRDADTQANTARYDLANSSGGNSNTYLANRIGLSANNTLNKANIRSQYDNMNAQIANQGKQFNIQNRYMTDDRNQANKDAAYKAYYSSIGQVGTNTASGMRDYRANQMDQQRMDMLKYIYQNPEFLKYIQTYKP